MCYSVHVCVSAVDNYVLLDGPVQIAQLPLL